MLKVIKDNLETEKFEKSMTQCFYNVGLSKGGDGKYLEYSPTRKGTLTQLMPQVQTSDKAVSVGEIASELAVTSRSNVSFLQAAARPADGGAGSSSAAIEEEFTEDESDAHSSDEEDPHEE